MGEHAMMSGILPTNLANAISDAIHAALDAGMEVDEACSVTIGVVRDYWNGSYAMDESAVAGLMTILLAKRCECYTCLTERKETVTLGGLTFPVAATRMIVCGTCGNKRCPHATDHRHTCTGSNEPGQPGSWYA